MRTTSAELLASVPLFSALEADDLSRLAAATKLASFGPDEPIVEIGDPGRALFVVVSGIVRVLYPARLTEFELARLGPGEFFGEMALLNDKPRSATVKALDKVEVLQLEKHDFQELVLEKPRVGLSILQSMSVRIRNADEQISGLSDKAVRDPLTNLLNRRAFNERIAEEIDRTRRYGEPFSLVLIDLDHFKAVNDTLGHDAGDAVLSWVGRILTEHTRAADIPFRIGGEEFAVLCPATSYDVALRAAQRLVDVVGEATPPVGHKITVTMSASFSTCPDHGSTLEEVFFVADQGLLSAKRAGRNQVYSPRTKT